jgi:hypothetical protein
MLFSQRYTGGIAGGTRGNPHFAERTDESGKRERFAFQSSAPFGFMSATMWSELAPKLSADASLRVSREGADLTDASDLALTTADLEIVVSLAPPETMPLIAVWWRRLRDANPTLAATLRRWCARNSSLHDPATVCAGNALRDGEPLRPWVPQDEAAE